MLRRLAFTSYYMKKKNLLFQVCPSHPNSQFVMFLVELVFSIGLFIEKSHLSLSAAQPGLWCHKSPCCIVHDHGSVAQLPTVQLEPQVSGAPSVRVRGRDRKDWNVIG